MEFYKTISEFNRLYYDSHVWEHHTHYKGIPVAKNPCDLWMYQQIIWETQPNIIIETGTGCGGSAMYLIDTMKRCFINNPLVITIDINKNYLEYKGIMQIQGSSVAMSTIDELNRIRLDRIRHNPKERTMVILDSSHTYEHVKKELRWYNSMVTEECYLIIEDTNNELYREGRGAKEAVEDFMPNNKEFEVDKNREKFMLTFNSGGYLRKTFI